jgi:hypothetical protein
LSATETAGELYLAGNKKTLKIAIGQKVFFVYIKDIKTILQSPAFHASIYRVLEASPEQRDPKPRQRLELTYSVVLQERSQAEDES